MTGSEYQKLAMRTCNIPSENKSDRFYHAVFGLNSEAGEVAGILQKKYQGHKADKQHMMKELGDCLWMIAEACEAIETSMDAVMEMNIEKLKAHGYNTLRLYADETDENYTGSAYARTADGGSLKSDCIIPKPRRVTLEEIEKHAIWFLGAATPKLG